jgi:outer membrane protein assembly factor BamA
MRLLTLLILTFSLHLIYGQKKLSVYIETVSYQHAVKTKSNEVKDSIDALNVVRSYQNQLIEKGFFLASLDSINWKDREVYVYFTTGESFEEINLIVPFSKGGLKLSPNDLSNLVQKELNKALNTGYPFANVTLKNIQIDNNRINAELSVEKGTYYKWKEVIVKGDSSISSQLVQSITQIKPGSHYSEISIMDLSKKIAQTPYIEEIKPFEVLFTDDGVELYLYLRSLPISSANGLLGLQTDPTLNRYYLSGDLSLKLTNVLKRGESIKLKWRSIQPQSPLLNVSLNYPFLFKSPFGVNLNLDLFKKDSTFLEVKSSLGVQYSMSNGNIINVFYRNQNSNRLNSSTQSNDLGDIKMSNYGIGFEHKKLDYIPNPTRGIEYYFSGYSGSRRSRNSDTSQFIKTSTFGGSFVLNYYLPFTKRNVLKFGIQTETYYTPSIYFNELSRIGGLTSLRGFNEQEIYASTFSILTFEYRFILDRNSNLFVFYDQGFYEKNSISYLQDHPFGFGGGISFGTKIGSFVITYALGKQFTNPILLKDGKIHFGYIAYF